MREEEFEKQVRKKMDQLGFTPSESVWTGVDREINQEKKRRVPLFWLFFVSGLLLAGGSYYFISNKNTAALIPNKDSENAIAKIPEKETSGNKQTGQPLPRETRGPTVLPTDALAKAGQRSTSSPQKAGANRQTLPREMRGSTLNRQPRGFTPDKNTAHTRRMGAAKETNEAGEVAAAAGVGDIIVNNYSSQSAKTEAEGENKKLTDSTAGKIVAATTQIKSKKDSVTSTSTANTKEQKKKSSDWKIGYTAGLGSSNLNQNLFNSVKTLSAVNLSVNTNVNNAGPINYSSSEISPGFSFDAGAFVNKNLSKRISFSAGINYHYYSTRIRTGMKINTALGTYNSMGQPIRATSYYENGQSETFTNQYHFIELPLSVNFQIIKSKKTPVIWELGVTPGYIVSSDALYYDPNTNVYFSKYLQPNKMQINGTTALMIGLPLYKGELQVGPQLQYGFTGFVNTNDGNPGHLFYVGLKISFIPGKK